MDKFTQYNSELNTLKSEKELVSLELLKLQLEALDASDTDLPLSLQAVYAKIEAIEHRLQEREALDYYRIFQ